MSDSPALNLSSRELRDVELSARIEVARKVGLLVTRKDIGNSERDQALALARLLVEDASISVREALSRELRQCRFLPDDVVHKLSKDIDQVSIPFLISSQAVSDEMLEELVMNGSSGVQDAIAGRTDLSEMVAFAICDQAELVAVDTLMGNDTAVVSERSSRRTIDRFPAHQTLLEKMAKRSDMSPNVVEEIIFKISETYARYLVDRFNLSKDYSSYLAGLSNRSVFNMTLNGARQSEIERYLGQLHQRKALTSDHLLNYVQNGHLRLFIMAIAVQVEREFDVLQQGLSGGNEKLLVRLLDKIGYSKSVVGVMVISYKRLFGKT